MPIKYQANIPGFVAASTGKSRTLTITKKRTKKGKKKVKQNFENGVVNVRIRKTTPITVAAITNANEAYTPSLGNIPAAELAAYTALYDEFKIKSYTVSLVPRGNQSGQAAGVNALQMYGVVDYTDATPLVSIDQAMEYLNCRNALFVKPFTRKIYPKVTILMKDVNDNPFMLTMRPQWQQLEPQTIGGTPYDNTVTPYLGYKIISSQATAAITFDEVITYHIQFKGRK